MLATYGGSESPKKLSKNLEAENVLAEDRYRGDRMEGMGIITPKNSPEANIAMTRKERWAYTVAKMYLRSLRTGVTPHYPTDPADIQRTGWVR